MNKKITVISFLIVAILFVSAIAGTIIYYNSQITNLNSQISNLKSQIANLAVNLEASLGITEIPSNSSFNVHFSTKYSHLYLSGSVTNVGNSTAYNAGLHIIAYTANSTLEINMTVPLVNDEAFGTDAGTNNYVSANLGSNLLQLGILQSEQKVTVSISIYHEGTVSKWTVTPVWTNSP